MMMQGVVNKAQADARAQKVGGPSLFGGAPNQKKPSGGFVSGTGPKKPNFRAPLDGMTQANAANQQTVNKKKQTMADLALLILKKKRLERAAEEGKSVKNEADKETKFEKFLECIGRIGLNHISLILILVIYAFIGAAIFEATEESNELQTRQDRKRDLNSFADNLTAQIVALDSADNREAAIRQLIRDYQLKEDLWPTDIPNWDFWGALFFAGTIFTTIGYGHYFPVTTLGRIATMLYAVIGIPLVLAVLSDLGALMGKYLKRVYSKIRLLNCCGKQMKPWDSTKGDSYEKWLNSEEFDIPIPAAILLLIGWIFLCAAVFCIWETEWMFFEAFYFFFISLTTIGLGDITPNHPRLMIAGCVFVIIGLALISMVINLIQIKLEELKEYTADTIEEQLGWDTGSDTSDDDDDNGDERRPLNHHHHSSRDGSQPNLPTSLGIFSTGMIHHHKSPSQNPISNVADKWKAHAGMRRRRRRRGIQTDESYLHSVRLRFPHTNYLDIPHEDLYKSRDDINSLVDQLELIRA